MTHPSYSNELLEKKKQNNIIKYGVPCTLTLPSVREKANQTLVLQSTKDKRHQTILDLYGVDYISQNLEIKEQIASTRKALSNRKIVMLIREYKRVFKITLTEGWYQISDNQLTDILTNIKQQYGVFSIEELLKIKVVKKYSNSIKCLQERPVVKEIKKYKIKYGRNLKLGRSWDRKQEDQLVQILQDLIYKYGVIDC